MHSEGNPSDGMVLCMQVHLAATGIAIPMLTAVHMWTPSHSRAALAACRHRCRQTPWHTCLLETGRTVHRMQARLSCVPAAVAVTQAVTLCCFPGHDALQYAT